MKVSKSYTFSFIFFLIFILGLIFFVSVINKSLNKKTDVLLIEQPAKVLALTPGLK